jgi:hypothetical protein
MPSPTELVLVPLLLPQKVGAASALTSVFAESTDTTGKNNQVVPQDWRGVCVSIQAEGGDVHVLFSESASCVVLRTASNSSTPERIGWKIPSGTSIDRYIPASVQSWAFQADSGTPIIRVQVTSRVIENLTRSQ